MVISRLLEPKRANAHKVNHQATGGRATDSLRTHPRSYAAHGMGGICTAGESSSEKVASFITPIDCLTVPNVSEVPLGVYEVKPDRANAVAVLDLQIRSFYPD